MLAIDINLFLCESPFLTRNLAGNLGTGFQGIEDGFEFGIVVGGVHHSDQNVSQKILKGYGSYLGFQEAEFVGKFEKWIDWYWNRASEKIQLRLLAETDTEAEARMSGKGYKQREIVFWKKSVNFTATTWVMGDYVVMFVLSSSPHYLVEIHDARFAENQRALFKAILEDIDATRSHRMEIRS